MSTVSLLGSGKLVLFTGCMKAGKTTQVLLKLNEYIIKGNDEKAIAPRVLFINHKQNTRSFVSRNQLFKAMTKIKLIDVINSGDLKSVDISKYNAIGIDEGQFFDDLDVSVKWATAGKDVYVAALNGTYQQKMFKSVIAIIPYAIIITLDALCDDCLTESKGTSARKAITTYKTSSGDNLIEIGDSQYLALCLQHLASRVAKLQQVSTNHQ